MKMLRLVAVALLAPCAALANSFDDVRAGGGAVIPSVGVSIDVAGNSAVQDHTMLSHAIDMGFSYARARHKQDRDIGDQPVVLGGTTFLDTDRDIQWTSNIQLAHIGYRPRWWIAGSNFALEGVIGVGWAGLGIKGEANGKVAAERLSNGGFVFGLGGIWRFAQATSLQVRFLNFYSGKDEGVTSAGRFDLSVAHAVAKNAQVRAGFGVLSAYSAREDNDSGIHKSPVRAGGAGLFLGLDFNF